jgi:hypothetical protein
VDSLAEVVGGAGAALARGAIRVDTWPGGGGVAADGAGTVSAGSVAGGVRAGQAGVVVAREGEGVTVVAAGAAGACGAVRVDTCVAATGESGLGA